MSFQRKKPETIFEENKKYFNEKSELGGDDIYSASKACKEIITRSFFLSFKNNYTSIDMFAIFHFQY